MMFWLIRRDAALRRLPMWGVVLLLTANLLVGLLSAVVRRQQVPMSGTALELLGWATIALYLVVGPGRVRAIDHDLALPIPARRFWLAHLVASVLGGLFLAGAYMAIVAMYTRLPRGGTSLDTDLWDMALLLLAATPLAAALLQIPRPSLARIPFTAGYAAWLTLILLATLVLLPAVLNVARLAGLVLLAGAVVVAVAGYIRVPPAFVLVPREPRAERVSAAHTPAVEAGPEEAGRSLSLARWIALFAVLRCFSLGAKELVVIPFIVFAGLFLGGGLGGWEDSRDLRFLYIPLGAYLLYSFAAPRLARLHHLDPMPLSRRITFAGLVLPSGLIFAASFGAGAWIGARSDRPTEYVNFQQQENNGPWGVTVPLRVYRVAWDGRPPVITSPWGESRTAESWPIVRGSRAVIWNPFSAPAGSSARFVALQISRAVEDVYGASITPEEIERLWIETLSDGRIVGRNPSLHLRAGRPGLAPRSGPVHPVTLSLIFAPWLLLLAILQSAYRPGIASWIRHLAFWGVLGLFVATILAEGGAILAGLARPWIVRALVEIPARAIGQSAIGTAAVWGCCALLVLGSYLLAETRFARMEIPTKPLKFTLLELLADRGR